MSLAKSADINDGPIGDSRPSERVLRSQQLIRVVDVSCVVVDILDAGNLTGGVIVNGFDSLRPRAVLRIYRDAGWQCMSRIVIKDNG